MSKSKENETQDKDQVKLVTWNILAHEWTAYNTLDGKLESEQEKTRRWTQIVETLNQQNADIVFLQEVSPSCLLFLQSRLSSDFVRFKENDKIGCVTFISSKKFVVQKAVNTPLPAQNPEEKVKIRRAVTVVVRSLHEPNQHLILINAHLDGYPPLELLRQQQAQTAFAESLAVWNESLKKESDPTNVQLGVVLAGDFNELKYTNFKFTCVDLEKQTGSLVLCNPLESKERMYPTSFFVYKEEKSQKEEGKGIDYIWASQSLSMTKPMSILPCKKDGSFFPLKDFPAVPFKDVSWPSDHALLSLEFKFSQSKFG
jgi:endonuclease/exonuclease/phosphatase family metal-dependent hydrolase